MSNQRLKSLRALAFLAQSGRCYYCGLAMWQSSPGELALRPRSAGPLRCTAEHIVARQDGGKDMVGNVVAAHAACNYRRHKRSAPAPSATDYRTLVQRQLAKGKWWPRWVHGLGGGAP